MYVCIRNMIKQFSLNSTLILKYELGLLVNSLICMIVNFETQEIKT